MRRKFKRWIIATFYISGDMFSKIYRDAQRYNRLKAIRESKKIYDISDMD